MADYIYLLETRLSRAQRSAIEAVRDVARAKSITVFLVGGAVRDLTSGSPVRDLDVVVQGNALKLRKDLEKAGASVAGESESGQALFLNFPGGVRMEVGSTLSATYPKPGKPMLKPASLLDDLRRRDFTANAMALSLNEGSFGLLMDPLNGVADIENRELRLVSNYGFIEDPVRMIRAVRLMARLGWRMEEKTQARYETGKEEGYIATMGDFHRGYETEEIFHEEDPLRVMRRLEEEGWMQQMFPALTVGKANVAELERLRETQMQMQMQGIQADAASANFPLLTGKLNGGEITELKRMFPRQGFVAQINGLDAEAKEFAGQMLAKAGALPSRAYQMIHGAKPEAVLWAAHTSKSGALQAKFKSFYGDWPQARQRIPYVLMQEMRIVPEHPQYAELVEKVFYELMDGRLGTVEEMKAYLEPYSPPAPPPPVHLRRARAAKKDAKGAKGRKKAVASVDLDEEDEEREEQEIDAEDAEMQDMAGPEEDEGTEAEAGELAKIEAVPVKEIPPKEATAVQASAKPAAPVAAATKEAKAAAPVKVAAPAKEASGEAAGTATETREAKPSSKSTPAPGIKKEVEVEQPAVKAAPAKKVAVAAPVAAAKKASVKAPVKAAKKAAVAKKAAPLPAAKKSLPAVGKKAVVPAKASAKKAPVKVAAQVTKSGAKLASGKKTIAKKKSH